ncbi:MAG: DUF4129 domain-containing protein [Verrucomicrobiales bacterium]|nr:DUF4129 domain-containing protein [Verrucomicrobiales bacterium]
MKLPSEIDNLGVLDRLESAVHLLRETPAVDFLIWLSGSGPFALGLLFFCADQSRSSIAAERLPVTSLGLALLFLWARLTQAAFAGRLQARVSGEPSPPGFLSLLKPSLVPVLAWQPLALAVLPMALILVIPFPAFLAFQQGLLATAARSGGSARQNLSGALPHLFRQPGRASGETSLLVLAWLVLLINTGALLFTLPHAAKLLLGIESPFTLNASAALNTTFLAAAVVLATTLLNPLALAVAVLRDFERRAESSGADLLALLRRTAARGTLSLALLLATLGTPASASAATPPASASSHGHGHAIPPPELNRAIVEVLDQPEFTWREPRRIAPESEKDRNRSLLERAFAWIGRILDRVGHWLEGPLNQFSSWLSRLLGSGKAPTPPPVKMDLTGLMEFLMWLLVVAGAAVIGIFGYRIWSARRRAASPAVTAMADDTAPDLESAAVSAELLPEDGWMALAHELAGRGEFRLALRAAFLACLSRLAEHQWIRLAQFRSNREYERDVRRRMLGHPETAETFSEIVRIFERSWYGDRPVTPERFADFVAAVERLRPA